MRLISKTRRILSSRDGETMAEVIIAFVVLMLIMAVFANGMKFAGSAQAYAIDNKNNADHAMLELQKELAGQGDSAASIQLGASAPASRGAAADAITAKCYVVPGEGDEVSITYWVFGADA